MFFRENIQADELLVGIDIGSTTTKIVAVTPQEEEIVYWDYQRHNAEQARSVKAALEKFQQYFPQIAIRLCLTGSGAKLLAENLNAPFVQEVVANSVALKRRYDRVGTAIELGGQDAKIIFFRKDGQSGQLSVADMRMNGSCAGGTGAFIDEVASILKVPVEEFDALASQGSCVYDISGRCGVYAKTDIQPLLNQGASRADLALSAFHAIAKQTIGGLAQGLDIEKPVVFEGGPLTFNPTLIRVFKERLTLEETDVLVPEHPEIMVAYGAAVSLTEMFQQEQVWYTLPEMQEQLRRAQKALTKGLGQDGVPFFASEEERRQFHERHARPQYTWGRIERGSQVRAYLGIDSGSTTTKFVLMDQQETILDSFYAPNEGNPLMVAKEALIAMRERYRQAGANLEIIAVGTTGYGSFLENFAASLHISVKDIAEAAFASKNPAVLGSRCTVFMNSSVITEQRNGKLSEDIMAGLCRSIIENVFTKVIRISNLDSLGQRIVVQGGTFENDAVLRAMEQYTGREVIRAPYPGIMGAIGAALTVKEQCEKGAVARTFIGLDAMDGFSYTQEANLTCPFCMNHCKRTLVTFSNGKTWVTNNRCERGEVIGDPKDEAVKQRLREKQQKKDEVPNLFALREKLLFQPYDYERLEPEKETVIGLPRVLSYWETMPFWTTFWKALGFQVRVSAPSTRKMYESGLSAVTSDTVCFPAKLVHGHLRDLARQGVDRIFMPSITVVPSENTEKTSQSMCAVVKGYPIVVRNSDNPEKQLEVPFDAPLFHWYENEDRNRQMVAYMRDTFGIEKDHVLSAIAMGDAAQETFHKAMKEAGGKVLEDVREKGTFAVVLASRPYQNDPLVNHELPQMFTRLGIPVLTADSVPGSERVDLSKSRLDVVNNYHARMLSTAVMAAESEHLEYVQIVSFGCGHDAYLSDEIIRMMREISGKVPLVLKVDESDIQGPLGIRVRSFVETVRMGRERGKTHGVHKLQDPYPVKFTKRSKKEKIVLVPNTSHAFSRIMSAAFKGQGLRAEPLDIGREEAIRLGKQYVHNDICFPAQIVIGEALAALRSGKYDDKEVAIGMGKYIGDCRLTHYSALLRKALDDAGYSHVSIITNDDVDYHDLHPGFKMNLFSALRIALALPMIDALEELLRKIRPYEVEAGGADKAFEAAMDALIEGMESPDLLGAAKGFKRSIAIMNEVRYDRSAPKPTVLIVGEYLLNFHPGANHDIEAYLEKNGFEIIEARMTDVIRKTYFYQDTQIREYHLKKSPDKKVWYRTANCVFNFAHWLTDKIAVGHPLYEPACRMQDLVKKSDPIIHHTFDAGEGVLIPGEILHHAGKGCRSFVILQPFGCLPNHVVGRGITKRLKELYPDIQVLPLDYDPDVSFANVENRLQMLVVNRANDQKAAEAHANESTEAPKITAPV